MHALDMTTTLLNSDMTGKRLFTYKIMHDAGSAPNPFHGICTLAICKPQIRSVAKVGDIVVGLEQGDSGRIICCMEISKKMPWQDYIDQCKKPDGELSKIKWNKKIPDSVQNQGDCIWKDASHYESAFTSLSSHQGQEDFNTDVIKGKNVLAGDVFWYFGKGDKYSISLPASLKKIIPGRGHQSNANQGYRDDFISFFNKTLLENKISEPGVYGTPTLAPEAVKGCGTAERSKVDCGRTC